jgi:hypothetical protein
LCTLYYLLDKTNYLGYDEQVWIEVGCIFGGTGGSAAGMLLNKAAGRQTVEWNCDFMALSRPKSRS